MRVHWSMLLTSVSVGLVGACAEPEAETVAETAREVTVRAPVPAKELLINDLSVVEATPYTLYDPRKRPDDPAGAWTFGRLIDGIAGEDLNESERTLAVMTWLRFWENDQTVNGFVVPARPAIRSLVVDPWRAASGCAPDSAPIGGPPSVDCVLDFARAPFRLLAIVYRPDLRTAKGSGPSFTGNGGQGRFVFGVLSKNADGSERRLPFTVIFEYQLPVNKPDEVRTRWANKFHELGAKPFGNDYNKKLFELTKAFTKRDAAHGAPNGSALLQVRTNEIALSAETPRLWELREFVLVGGDHGATVVETTVKDEPDESWSGTPELGDFVAANAAAFLGAGIHLPESLTGAPFLAGRALPRATFTWEVPSVSEDLRHAFALATCSGCHFAETGGATGTNFLHVKNRESGVASLLSPFLSDQLANARSADLAQLLANGP